jgi:YggT family protein
LKKSQKRDLDAAENGGGARRAGAARDAAGDIHLARRRDAYPRRVDFPAHTLPRSSRLGYLRHSPPARKDHPLLAVTLFQIVGYLISVVVMLVIVQFVMSLLIAFNVINMHNDFVAAVWKAINALLEPMLAPIRKIMPDTGAIDFSPMVLIVLLQIVRIILSNLAYAPG